MILARVAAIRGKDVTRMGGWGVEGSVCVCGFGGRCGLGGTKSLPSTRCVALTVMSPDRHFNKKKKLFSVMGGRAKKSTSSSQF